MSVHAHTAATPDGQTAGHASVATYVRVALILTVVTALEVGVIYIRFLSPIIVPLLLVMATAKFALVVMFFMHLRYDPRPLSGLFVGPLLMATLLSLALIALVGTLFTLHR